MTKKIEGRVLLLWNDDFTGIYLLSALLKMGGEVIVYPLKGDIKYRDSFPDDVEVISDELLSEIKTDDELNFNSIVILTNPFMDEEEMELISDEIERLKKFEPEKVVLVSSLGAKPNARVKNYRDMWSIEEAVRVSGSPFTIVKPSLIFGKRDDFTVHILNLTEESFLIAYTGDGYIQPVWIGDVIKVIIYCLMSEYTNYRSFELGGSEVLSIRGYLEKLARYRRERFLLVPVPGFLTGSENSWRQKFFRLDEVIRRLDGISTNHTCKVKPLRRWFHIPTVSLDEYLMGI